MGIQSLLKRLPVQLGDMQKTWADAGKAERMLGYRLMAPLDVGLGRFAEWLRDNQG